MKKISMYILNQVAANHLSIDDAKTMLLELQNQEASQTANALSEDTMTNSQQLAQGASSEDVMANSQHLAQGASSEYAMANSQQLAQGASSEYAMANSQQLAQGASSEYVMANSQKLAQGASSGYAMANSQKLAQATSSEVAIIGMAGKFPKAANLEEYWNHLKHGVNCIDHFPENRKRDYWDQCSQSAFMRLLTGFSPGDIHQMDDQYVKGGFLSEIDKFDAAFFRIPPKEALYMDPIQRVFLEIVYEAIEDAGYGGKKIQDAKVGVFAGKDHTAGTMYRYVTEPDPMSLTGSWTGILASRISYIFNLRGPSLVVDTACSSGLVALHEACRALHHNECELAIAGGIHLQLFPVKKGSSQVMDMVESADEQVKTFDKTASGTVWGEGAGAVFLKPLMKAIADGDHIYAVIKGSAINNDGASSGITAPNADAQKEVILRAWKEAQIDPETISYIEAHGTGTNLGDPIEIKGITAAFSEHTDKKQFCGIGSAKTNVGHLVAASGLASVIKVVLALKNNLLPPSINFKTPNPYINFGDSPVYVNDQPHPWAPGGASPRRAGISSFGFSGTNCHIVLEEAPPVPKELMATEARPEILTLSARGKNVLQELLQRYQSFLENPAEGRFTGGVADDLTDICYTANTGRGHYQYRIAIVATNMEDLKGKITRFNLMDWDEIQESGIYYGAHKIVAAHKSSPGENQITENERRQLTAEATRKLQGLASAVAGTPEFLELAEALCRLYVNGADVLWDKLYQGRTVHRISLPTYPLERIKCWAKPNGMLIEGLDSNLKPLHPLIHRLLLETLAEKVYHTAFNVKTHWVLNEHQVLNYYVIPGTTYLEMARVASGAYFQNGPVELRDFLFMTPLVVNPDETQEVHTIIKMQSEYLDFVVTSKTAAGLEDNPWVIHAQGKIYQVKPEETRLYNLMELKQRLDAGHNQREIYPAEEFDENGFTLGPRWRNVVRTIVSRDEALLQIKLPEEFEADLQDFHLHPALMDQAVNAFSQEMGTGMYLPFMYKKLTVYGPMPVSFYSYLRRKGETGANMETITMDISLVDESGRVFAEVFDYSIKKARDMESNFKKLTGAENTYYGFEWIPVESGGTYPAPEAGSILVFKDQAGIAAPIIRKLKELGRSLIEVEVGSEFQQVNQNQFLIHGEETDYQRLLRTLSNQKISQILHFMAIGQNPVEPETRFLEGMDSLFYLARALAEHNYPETIELILFADNVQEVSRVEEQLNPHHAAFFGLGKVVSLENQQIKIRVIDLDRETTPDRIAAEIQTQDPPYQTAYRRNQRFVEEFRRIEPELKPGPVIHENGVYVITGGIGGIGLEIGRYLAGKARVKLALINRSPFPSREDWDEMLQQNEDRKLGAKITAIREMERAGSEVMLCSADVANEAALKPTLEEVRHKFGKINGVIHAAGIAGAGFMIKKDIHGFKKVIAPKVRGTWLLDRLTAQDNLDFFILFSSITTLTGGLGQSDYTAANSYLDAFAAFRNRQGKRTITINWPLWNGIGMAADYQVTDQDLIFKALTHRKATEMLDEILNSDFLAPAPTSANLYVGASGPTPTYARVIPGELNYQVINAAQGKLPFQLSDQITAALKKQRERNQVEALPLKDKVYQKAAVLGLTGDNEDTTPYLLAQIWARVLGLNEIEIDQNFYDMGGDSILASQLLNEINREYPDVVSISDIFTYSSVAKLAEYIDQKGGLKKAGTSGSNPVEDWSIKTIAVQEYYPSGYYPVSSAQRRMFILNQIEGANVAYNLPFVLMVEGNLDRERLEAAIRNLIKRQESLRTSFEMLAEDPVQRIHPTVEFQIEYWDMADDAVWNGHTRSIPGVIRDFIRPFDLSNAPLLRVGLVKLAPGRHLLMFDMHHIISDGTSLGIFFREFMSLYEGRDLPELRIHYKDFAVWENEYLKSEKVRKQEEYWLSIFPPTGGGELPLLNLPLDYPRPAAQSFEGDQVEFEIGPELTARLNQLAAENGATLFMVLLAAFNVLLFKYTGQEDIIIGTPVAGRSRAEVEPMIGVFINTLALRNYPAGDQPFKGLLAEVKANALQAFDNQEYQYEKLIDRLNLKRDLSRNPLFDVMFILQNRNLNIQAMEATNLRFTPYSYENRTAKFDLTLQTIEAGDQIIFLLEYWTRLFAKETILRFTRHFTNILTAITAQPEIQLKALEILTVTEKQQILRDFNDTAVEYSKHKTIHQLFEEQAERTPEQVAVIFENQQLTYRELNQRTNQLARVLRERGVKPDQLVGIMVERSLEMIIGLLGILKAGGAYLPIDPGFPEERIRYMLDNSQTKILLTSDESARITGAEAATVALNNPEIYRENHSGLERVNSSQDLAYLIYTSGSTGEPKGVMIEHRALHNFIVGVTARIDFSPAKSILALTTISFDIFGLETLLPLTRGMSVVIAPESAQLDPRSLSELMVKHQIGMLQTTPSRMQMLLSDANSRSCLENVTEIMIGGEAVPESLVNEVRKLTKAKIYNMYGPTETTIWSTVKDLTNETSVNIGSPIANTQIYIVDPNYQPQPIGVAGELCIAGDGLARGYWGRPELTGEKFVVGAIRVGAFRETPLRESAERMYRTGDLARWLPDGNIEFLGRMDNQVKIRGYRIELGEIEAQLLKYEPVKEAVVVAISDGAATEDGSGGRRLCAYLVSEEGLRVSELRDFLRKSLPDYMIPAYFVQLEQFPRTPNGKVDRKALASGKAPQLNRNIDVGTAYEPPNTELEKELTKAWQDVLGVSPIGINDNFFNLGGDSMKALQIISQLRHLEINLRDIFRYTTIAEISRYYNTQRAAEKASVNVGEVIPIGTDPRLGYEYYYHNDGAVDLFTTSLDCIQALLYIILKNKVNDETPQMMNLRNPYELFLRDITFYVSQNQNGLITDIDFLDQRINTDVFKVNRYQGKGAKALSRIETLLDQGELVILQAFNERLPFFRNFIGFEAPEELIQLGHAFLLVWRNQDQLYYVDAPWDINQRNFTPYAPNKSIGVIKRDELKPALQVNVNYLTATIKNSGLPDMQQSLKLITEIMSQMKANYGKKAKKQGELKVVYGKEALETFVEICGRECLSLNQEIVPGGLNLYGLFYWKFWGIISRRKVFNLCLRKFASRWDPIEANKLCNLMDATIRAWANTLYFLEAQYNHQRYLLDLESQKYFVKIANLEAEVFAALQKL